MADTLIQVAPHVWIFPRDINDQSSVGVISTDTQTVLVDGGNSPNLARRILTALQGIDAPPMRYIIYTHHHWDHVFGASVFEVPVIAHEGCRDQLIAMAAQPWSQAYVQEVIQQNPRLTESYTALEKAITNWDEVRLCVPTITFSQCLRLHLDDLTIELEHVGGQHASDSIVVRVLESQVIFLGDCYYAPPLHLRTPESTNDWNMLESLIDDSLELYIASHGDPKTLAEMRSSLSTLKDQNNR